MPRTVSTVADLTKHHEGKPIRIPDLQQPGLDFDAPSHRRGGTTAAPGRGRLVVARRPAPQRRRPLLDTPLPPSHPCYLTAEDPARPEPVELSLFEESA